MGQTNKEIKKHYKMYKKGRTWLFAATISTIIVGWGTITANAESATSAPLVNVTSQTNQAPASSISPNNQKQPLSAASNAASQDPKQQESQTSGVSATDSTPEPLALPTSQVNAETTVSSPHSQSNIMSTQSVSDASQTITETSNAANVTPKANSSTNQSYVSSIQSRALPLDFIQTTETPNLNNVTKNNIDDFFNVNGNASYDKTNGIVTLTPNQTNQSGNITLKDKINMDESFTLTGQINLGDKAQHAGADGISFGFHDGNPDEVGLKGGAMGLGGLSNAFGWKADTYWNQAGTAEDAGYFEADPTKFRGNSGTSGHHYDGEGFPFGSFVYTQNNNNVQEALNYTGSDAPAQEINSPAGNVFEPISFQYNGQTKIMTLNFEGKKWTKDVSSWIHSNAEAFFITASTGGSNNLQQFLLDSFVYSTAATVNVKYVNQQGTELAQDTAQYPDGAYTGKPYTTTQKEIANYNFIKMGEKSLAKSGTLTKPGDNGTVVYVYAPAYTTTFKNVKQEIDYVDQTGAQLSPKHDTTVTFITVKNPLDTTTTIYFSNGSYTSATLNDNGIPEGTNWTKGTGTNFGEVKNPTVSGYYVTSNNAPLSNLTAVAQQSVTVNDNDQLFTVVYSPIFSVANTKTVNETINYVDENNQIVSPQFKAHPITFVTIENNQSSSQTVYYSNTLSTPKIDIDTGIPKGDWHTGTPNFISVVNPVINGLHVVHTNALNSDLVQVAAQTVTGTSQDLVFTIVYANDERTYPVQPEIPVTPSHPGTPVPPSLPQTPQEQYVPSIPSEPATSFTPSVQPKTSNQPSTPTALVNEPVVPIESMPNERTQSNPPISKELSFSSEAAQQNIVNSDVRPTYRKTVEPMMKDHRISTKAAILPKTNEDSDKPMRTLGASILALISSLWTLGRYKRRH
ncbi:MAG: MucBP domain-containing protein [Furfurilactobacillus sp.]|jgi:hypothetical protein|uniref:lectin-like domain-containing protein n=1 Tax=Furfurilactobacillus TaxID=2767882 RepID=UPI001F44CF70|nr:MULTISPECIES: MucBP domain-containing protein [Furfurilactobacillus]MCF6420047.1 MucBP domain-containing protein [Furfurilactobacillus milii]MCH4012217.1 MucBP domain-containing protein [Furfurilactobacillus sp.]MCH4038109.1 MucBP domain-containing protein [Furfurilactobacillus sp.]MCH4115254.1 MucBP domain-containing protein [Furfurilactobacillus sp.]MCI1340036.1 MucBP domain-containing protein [Furfurilactobacillus sp.]